MKTKLLTVIKRKFKKEIFTNLIKEDIERYGKGMHSINSAYIGIEWALNQSDEIKNLIENNGYEKGFQDAFEKAKSIIINFMPLPSPENHNLIYNVDLLEQRQEYAKKFVVMFEEKMNDNVRGV